MAKEIREYADVADVTDLLDSTAEWENPFVPAPLGDTVVMENGWSGSQENTAV